MNVEKRVVQLREEISRRLGETRQLRERSASLMSGGSLDEGIAASEKAAATDRAVGVLRGKLQALLPDLVQERLGKAVPALEDREREQLAALEAERKQAEEDFREFFRGWNRLLNTALGKTVAAQLFGDFARRIVHAGRPAVLADPPVYKLALQQHETARRVGIENAASAERSQLAERIRGEVGALATVDAEAATEVPA